MPRENRYYFNLFLPLQAQELKNLCLQDAQQNYIKLSNETEVQTHLMKIIHRQFAFPNIPLKPIKPDSIPTDEKME
jgi:hypothetical protein